MNRHIIPVLLSTLSITASADPVATDRAPDFIRFSEKANSDTLHGKFISFEKSDTVIFKGTEAAEPTPFSTKKLHRITFGKGRAEQMLVPSSSVTLINGDVIPGKITHADAKNVTLETEHLGELTIPADRVSVISPMPHDGKLIYYGPMNADGWKTINSPKKKGAKENPQNKTANGGEKKDEQTLTNWKLIGGAWYSGTNKRNFLVRENTLPDVCKMKFQLGWRGSLYCNVAIHADLAPPENKGKDDPSGNMAATLGQCYVVSISSHSASLYLCSISADGQPKTDRVDQGNVGVGLSGKQEAEFEIRIDRPNKALLLYVNGDFKIKWDLGDKYRAPGKSLAFQNLRYSNSEMRVSEILITDWNGMRDSALSMQTEDRDVVLLTNGVDRFSGNFKQIKDEKIFFRGTFDNDLTIPLSSVQEIRLASGKLRKLPEEQADDAVRFYVQPFGRISGTPTGNENGRTKIQSDIVGHVSLDMKFVNLIDFSQQNSLLDFWDDNF